MGLTWVEAVIKNHNTDRHATAKALVDTAATLTVLPRRVATAKGAAELDECVGVVEVMGRKAYTHMLASNDLGIVLVDATTLELGFEVDPAVGKLKEAATYLL